jgi:hypothetical protein
MQSKLILSNKLFMENYSLFRHLDSDQVAGLLAVALEREAEATMAEDKTIRGPKAPTRWSNKFDLVRVLLHKLRMAPEVAGMPEEPMAERSSTNASALLIEVLKHSSKCDFVSTI